MRTARQGCRSGDPFWPSLTGGPGSAESASGTIDLGRFKVADDTFGHLLGDQLLAAVKQRLRPESGPRPIAPRPGGDKFAFLFDGGENATSVQADRACDALSRPSKLGDLTRSIQASCGIAIARDVWNSAMSLHDRATHALHGAGGPPCISIAVRLVGHGRQVRSERA